MPRKMLIANPVSAYRSIYLNHSSYFDEDVVGKVFWINDVLHVDDKLSNMYTVVGGLTPATPYTISGSYYDAILDDELLNHKIGILESDEVKIATKIEPTIKNVYVTGSPVDVGVGEPLVNIELEGDADAIIVEKKLNTEGDDKWVPAYHGAMTTPISFTSIAGTFDFRVSGVITLPDGITTEHSAPAVITAVDVRYNFQPPSAPENIDFKVAKIMDGIERYDLQVSWDWDKGTGANVREFVLYFVDIDEYNKNKWTNASVMNGGAAKSLVISNFPFNKTYKFKAAAVAWGPDDQHITDSAETSFTITPNTPVDAGFVNETGIEVTYRHIQAFRKHNGIRQQSFLIDANTGSVAVGLLNDKGEAPISFDPIQGIVNVDGSVISKKIYTASLILSNLTGKENPSIHSSTKTSYGSANQGVWMGTDDGSGKFKFDLGDSTKYIRWDGDKLIISSNVEIGTPTGNIDIGTGIQGNFIGYVYRQSRTQPSRPVGSSYPPAGWSTTPNLAGTYPIWVSQAVINSKTNLVDSGSSWSSPVKFSGTDGVGSVNVYKLSTTKPANPTGSAIPPSGWDTTPPERVTGYSVWVSSASRAGDSNSITGSWSSPSKISGDNGSRGPGFYVQARSTFTSWSDSAATTFFNNNFSSGPSLYDVLTQYRTSDPSRAETKMWNGSSWVKPAVAVHGDMVVDGTIVGRHLQADTVGGREISASATIRAGSGSSTAGINGNDSNPSPSTPNNAGVRIWAGDEYGVVRPTLPATDLDRYAPFMVNSSGTLFASDCYIEGDIRATSGHFTGNIAVGRQSTSYTTIRGSITSPTQGILYAGHSDSSHSNFADYRFRLQANGGLTIRDNNLQNVLVIDPSSRTFEFKGDIYADRLIGDVVAGDSFRMSPLTVTSREYTDFPILRINIPEARPYERVCSITNGIRLRVKDISMVGETYIRRPNNTIIDRHICSLYDPTTTKVDDSYTIIPPGLTFPIEANTSGNFTIGFNMGKGQIGRSVTISAAPFGADFNRSYDVGVQIYRKGTSVSISKA